MPRPPLRVGVLYDFRNPPDSGIATPRLYAEILAQVAWLDGLGLDRVWFERFARDVAPRLRALCGDPPPAA